GSLLDLVNLVLELVSGLAVDNVAGLFNAILDGIFIALDESFSLALQIVKNRQQAPPFAPGAIGAPTFYSLVPCPTLSMTFFCMVPMNMPGAAYFPWLPLVGERR